MATHCGVKLHLAASQTRILTSLLVFALSPQIPAAWYYSERTVHFFVVIQCTVQKPDCIHLSKNDALLVCDT